ncbi:MAG: carbohydrate kinase family protein, partial [Halobacteriaceae archaeon]
ASAYAPNHVIKKCAGRDMQLVFDLAGQLDDLKHRGIDRRFIDDLLPEIECLIGNIESIRSYLNLNSTPEAMIRELLSRGLSKGAITMGESGAIIFDQASTHHIPAFEVDIVDTTGAGDAFTAGIIQKWVIEDSDPKSAGRFAAAFAALNCTVRGAHSNPPSTDQIQELL